MTNKEKYDGAFIEIFEIEAAQLPGVEYQSIQGWDSVGHMALIAKFEELFDIMMDTDDIIDLSSYERGMEILAANYDIKF